MRLLSWNLRDGGGKQGEPDRSPLIMDQLKTTLKPDIGVLQELNGWRRERESPQSAQLKECGLELILAEAPSGFNVGVVVRSGADIKNVKVTHEGLWHAAAQVDIGLTGSETVTVMGVHLNPFSGEKRVSEVATVLELLTGASKFTIVAGDFNSLHDGEDNEAVLASLPASSQGRFRRADGAADTRATRMMTDAGYVDVLDTLGSHTPTVPTKFAGQEFGGARLDYIYLSPALAGLLHSAEVVRNSTTDVASDHYPIVADVKGIELAATRTMPEGLGLP